MLWLRYCVLSLGYIASIGEGLNTASPCNCNINKVSNNYQANLQYIKRKKNKFICKIINSFLLIRFILSFKWNHIMLIVYYTMLAAYRLCSTMCGALSKHISDSAPSEALCWDHWRSCSTGYSRRGTKVCLRLYLLSIMYFHAYHKLLLLFIVNVTICNVEYENYEL